MVKCLYKYIIIIFHYYYYYFHILGLPNTEYINREFLSLTFTNRSRTFHSNGMEGLRAECKRMIESEKLENFAKMKIVPVFVVFFFIGVLW